MIEKRFPHKSDRPSHFPEKSTEIRVVPPIFTLGKAATKHEYLQGDRRLVKWSLTGVEEKISGIAGWDKFPLEIIESKGTGIISIPEATRNGKSILSGVEAWEGEKRTVVDAVADYIDRVEAEIGGYDANLGWDSVGITPERNIFFTPPNIILRADDPKVNQAKSQLVGILGTLLEGDEANKSLSESFEQRVRKG